MDNLIKIKEKVLNGIDITKNEAMLLVDENLKDLCNSANEIRQYYCKDTFDLCTIINGKSGKCSEDCKFCAQSSYYNTEIIGYSLLEKEGILNEAIKNENGGALRFSIVTSGKRLTKDEIDKVCETYIHINKNSSIKLCASHGLLDYEDLLKLKKSGVTRYHCNLETSKENFKNLCTTHTFTDKINTIKMAQKAGLSVCSGIILGINESMEDRISLAFSLKELGVLSVPINILSPIKGTPFENNEMLRIDEIKRTIAVFRFILPNATLRLAGGRANLEKTGEELYECSINGAITGDLLTTKGVTIEDDIKNIEKCGFKVKLNG